LETHKIVKETLYIFCSNILEICLQESFIMNTHLAHFEDYLILFVYNRLHQCKYIYSWECILNLPSLCFYFSRSTLYISVIPTLHKTDTFWFKRSGIATLHKTDTLWFKRSGIATLHKTDANWFKPSGIPTLHKTEANWFKPSGIATLHKTDANWFKPSGIPTLH